MKQARHILIVLLLLTMAGFARRRDPLTEAETDQLRDVAMEPGKRVNLYFKFAEARLTTIDELRADPKAADGRGKKIHDLLEDFTAIIDEVNDNIDRYQGWTFSKDDRKEYHKAMKEVIESSEKFDTKLQALQTAAQTDPQTQKEAPDFRIVLQDAIDVLKSSADMAKDYLNSKPDEPEKKK